MNSLTMQNSHNIAAQKFNAAHSHARKRGEVVFPSLEKLYEMGFSRLEGLSN